MSSETRGQCRYFTSYSGIKLPLKLVGSLDDADMGNRNTFYRGYFDNNERLLMCQKVVYGEVDMEHRYDYYDSGALKRAEIIATGEDARIVDFEEVTAP